MPVPAATSCADSVGSVRCSSTNALAAARWKAAVAGEHRDEFEHRLLVRGHRAVAADRACDQPGQRPAVLVLADVGHDRAVDRGPAGEPGELGPGDLDGQFVEPVAEPAAERAVGVADEELPRPAWPRPSRRCARPRVGSP
ncbi:hypothetical protein [Actinophytocola oryzae]|uniref:hypothetical protein n=1 Tax=Actinophytocola oryzae TaxID=502181 RepID=UPI001AAF1C44|nr:hypothetical protein [Actinophytocola oryzae]